MTRNYPLYDARDGQPDDDLAMKPIRDILGLAWNVGLERSIEHCALNHSRALRNLERAAKKSRENIMAAKLCNFAVTILVQEPQHEVTASATPEVAEMIDPQGALQRAGLLTVRAA